MLAWLLHISLQGRIEKQTSATFQISLLLQLVSHLLMAPQCHKPHFLLFPFMAQGHIIPMVDLAKLLSQRGATITIVTTPQNAARFESFLARATESGLQIRTVQLQFPSEEVGLPKGCENLDSLPSPDFGLVFMNSTNRLYDSSEKLFAEQSPRPSCIISDTCLPWTIQLAQKFHVPRIVFYSLSCFYLSCIRILKNNHALLNSASDSEFITLPDLPEELEFRKSQLPLPKDEETMKLSHEMEEADRVSYGVIINTFEELEPEYVNEFKRVKETDKIWCIGPVSLCNEEKLDKAERGNKASISGFECIKWLDEHPTCSVVYASLGSLSYLPTTQIIELGLGLEASKRPFIWVIRQRNSMQELDEWLLGYDFEEKTKGRGLVIRGWAPQVLILSHPATGGFLTHCGWNSTIEGISAGVPMITWPIFADQIFNAKLILEVLRIGVSVGTETCLDWGDQEKKGVVVRKENVKEAIEKLMDGDEREERRKRSKQLAETAKRAVEEGGSSRLNLSLLIEDIVKQAGCGEAAC